MANQDASLKGLLDMFIDMSPPVESYGMCKRKKCYGYGILGDGYCIACWDKGYPRPLPSNKTN